MDPDVQDLSFLYTLIGSKSHNPYGLQRAKDIWPLSPNEIVHGISLQKNTGMSLSNDE